VKISVDRLFHPDVEAIEVDQPVRVGGGLAGRYPSAVRLAAKINHISHGVFMRGVLSGIERETCARCLESFDRPIKIEVAEAFSEDVGKDEDFYADVSPLVDRSIDLTDLVSQILEVDEPMAALCSPSCQGICPTCGANRNHSACACRQTGSDPRLAGLARVRDEIENQPM
jgi:uncharacterized protein